jgi:hypothetical protein
MPLSFPSVGVQSINLRLVRSVAVTESAFSYEQQAHDFGGARWEAEITLPPLSHSEARSVEAFLVGLKGRSGTFTFGHPLHTHSGTFALASATAVRDETISVVTTDSVSAGNYFQLGNYLYMITEDISSGTSDIDIQPPMREVIASSTALDFTLPKSTWRLAANDIGWSTDAASLYGFTIPCVEAL